MGEGIGGLGRPYIKFELCPFANYSSAMEKGIFVYISFFTNFALIYWTCLIGFGGKSHRFWNLLLCLGMGEGIGRLGRPYIKFELCPFAIYSCIMEKGYTCYISFFTNFALIYWTCLIGFGGKSHRSCNLVHTVRDLD